MRLRSGQRGDTIMEVMICVAIIGLVMTTAFVLANKNTASSQMAQERSSGQKVADTQLELLRSYGDVVPLPDKSEYFCLVEDTTAPTGVRKVTWPAGTTPNANREIDDLTAYPSDCRQDNQRYSVIIWSPDNADLVGATSVTQYVVTVRWENVSGAAVEENKTFYNMYSLPPTGFWVGGVAPKLCDNDVDDDLDGFTDFDGGDPDGDGVANAANKDEGCDDAGDNDERNSQCSDGLDNDGDGRIDFVAGQESDITGCADRRGDSETNPICNNNLDDDVPSDGKKDFTAGANKDPGCDSYTDPSETDPPIKSTVDFATHTFESWHLANTGGDLPTKTFTFTNPSTQATLALGAATIGGTNATSFTKHSDTCSNTSLTPGATCTVVVRFTPATGSNNSFGNAGNKTATLSLVNNYTGLTATTASLSGTAWSDRLKSGETMSYEDQLYPYKAACYKNVETCGDDRMIVQSDGNLSFISSGCRRGWVGGAPGQRWLHMQPDGNLVLYMPNWVDYSFSASTNSADATTGSGTYYTRIYDDGQVWVVNGSDVGVKQLHNGGSISPCNG